MNNIYQVIWSYAKQCYVVTSELAKRHGKRDNGRGVRGMRMGVGGLRRGALALGVTAALLSGWTGVGTSVAHAESVNVPGGSEITISDNQSGVTYNLNGSNITFTVASEGSVHDIYGNGTASISLNTVYVYGTVSGSYVTGGYAFNGGEVTENTVTVSGDTALINGEVYGGNAGNGLQASGSATGNKVFIYGGMVKKAVYGGYSYSRDANENKVTIEDGSVVSVNGGYSPSQSAIKNQVTISGGSVTSSNVRAVVGGAGGSRGENSVTQENEVIIKGNAKVKGSVIGGADAGSPAVVNKNTVTIKDSAVIGESVYGGYGYYNVKDKTENKVFIEGGSVSGNVYGGYANFYPAGDEPAGNVKENEVHITGGTVGTFYKNDIAGGCVDTVGAGAAMDNSVTITGGTVKGRVYGGRVNNATGAATGNKLNISVKDASVADTVLENNAYGGYANGTGEVSKNYVTITGGTLNHHVYGGYSGGGAARNNTVVISGKNTNVGGDVYGGYNNETDNAEFTVNKNTVKITDATIGGDVSGGEGDQNVFENRVEITGGKFGKMDDISIVMGGSAYDGSATKNEVGISGGTQLIGEVYGGYSSNSQTANNIVTIDNATVKKSEQYGGNVYGGKSEGDATGNSVTISGTETQVEGKVYGGYISKSSTVATGNTVEIKGGTIGKSEGDTVFGGYANHGDSKQNNVSITGGTVNGGVVGGYAKTGDSNQNNVSITGGTVNGDVVGGDAYFDAAGNTITLSNCTINGGVFGSWTMDGETKNNTVNLTGKVSGLDGKYSVVSGGNYARTGNELHIGGTKDDSITGAWQGMTGDVVTNKISSVGEFESIVYHSVKWDKDVAALEATTVDNVKMLDITNMRFYTDAEGTMQKTSFTEGESMALLKSNSILGASGVGIGLTYKDGSTEKTATSAELAMGVTLGGGATDKTEDTGVNGVKLTQSITEKVKLSEDEYTINYSCEVGEVKAVTFNASTPITFADGGIARDLTGSTFASSNTVDADSLTFADSSEAIANGAFMTLVANATGIATTVANDTGKTIAIKDYEDAQKIKYSATATGAVTSDSTAVKFTVDSVTLGSVDLTSWTGTTSDLTTSNLSGWAGTSVAVATGDMANADLSDLNPGDTKPILTAGSGVTFTDDNISGNKKWQAGGTITDTDTSGVTVAGTMIGGGVKVDDTNKNVLVYQKDAKMITGITLGSVAFTKDGTVRSFDNSYNLTDADFTTTSFGISNASTATMNAGDTMVVVDAVNAIKGTGDATLQDFTTTNAGDAIAFTDQIKGKALTLSGTHQDTLEQNEAKNQILYKVGDKNVTAAIFTGEVAWNDSEAYYTNDTSKYKIAATNVDATDLKVTGTSTKALQKGDAMTLFSVEGMTATLAKDQSDANKTASKITVNYSDATSGIGFGAEATGTVETAAGAVNYKVTGVTINRVDLAGWNGTTSSVPGGWAIADGATINTDGLAAPAVEPGSHVDILQNDTDNYFASATISGANTYQSTDFKDEMNGVTLEGKQDKGVTLNSEKKHLIYAAGTKNTASVSFGAVEWQKDATLADAAAGYDFTNVSEIGTDKFDVTYAKPEDVAVNDSMTLLKANETLTAIVDELKTSSYKNYEIAPGVLMDGSITGTMSRSGNDVVFTATANQADKLTFTNVEWKDSGALLTRPANITFAGADVDTAKINFHNIQELAANSRMTLVSDFGETVGTITGDTFTVGSGLQGEGAASLSGTDLVFTAKTGAESLTPTEATHETVMAMEAGTAVVAAGREYVDSAVEGLGLVSNMAPDGTSTFASMGGGVGRYKTGSHVDTHTWSAVVAVGSKRDHKKGNLEWGVFAEYGRGNYTLHDDNGGRGDGNTHYAGGGLLAKWTNKHDVYTEASFRMGRMSDSASNMLRDVLGNTYGYDVHANYFGGHVGFGKIYKVQKTKDLDVYGKFFYTRRNGVDFDAGGNHYSLDSVASKLLRIGARYGSNDRKWNWYGGLAYEYEFGGESKGSVDGLAIRSASIKGASVRGEIGVRMDATKTNPWQTDISIYGYGGKHRGFGGSVNVAYTF